MRRITGVIVKTFTSNICERNFTICSTEEGREQRATGSGCEKLEILSHQDAESAVAYLWTKAVAIFARQDKRLHHFGIHKIAIELIQLR